MNVSLYKIQETLYTGQWCLSPIRSRHLGPHTVLPIAIRCPVVFPESHQWSEISSLSKVDFSFGKSQKSQGTKSGLQGGWVTWEIGCFAKNLCMRRDAQAGMLWWSCQSPVSHSWGLLNHLDSFRGGMFKLNAKFDADSLFYLLSHFECDGHTLHMLTQWCPPPSLTSTVTSSLFTHAYSSPLSLATRLHRCHANHSLYINSGWIFLDRHHMYNSAYNFRWFTDLTSSLLLQRHL